MAKKAAALQSFQKCDVGNLAIPSTIVEDTENRNNNEVMEDLDNFRVSFDQEDCDTDKFVMVESEAERGRRQSERGRLEMELGRLNERERQRQMERGSMVELENGKHAEEDRGRHFEMEKGRYCEMVKGRQHEVEKRIIHEEERGKQLKEPSDRIEIAVSPVPR